MGVTKTMGAKFEFFLSASFSDSLEAVPTDNNFVQKVALVQDDGTGTGTFTEIAVASYAEDDDDSLKRNFQLFYKGEVGLDVTGDFKVQITTTNNGGVLPIFYMGGDIQWGFKVYRDEYPLTTTTIPDLC